MSNFARPTYMSALSINSMSVEILLQRSSPEGAARQEGREMCGKSLQLAAPLPELLGVLAI